MLVAHACPALCDSTDCSPPGSSVHGILQTRTLEWVAIPFSRGIFPTQGSNLGLLHCGQILYRVSHQGRLILRGPQRERLAAFWGTSEMPQEVRSGSQLLLCHQRRGVPPATDPGLHPSSPYGLRAATAPWGGAGATPSARRRRAEWGESAREKFNNSWVGHRPFPFSAPWRREATGRARQLLPELKPRSARGPLPSVHPRVHTPWSGEGHAQTRWAHPMWLLYK